MQTTEKTVRWAPRVNLAKIRKLYNTDALGLVDEELIDEVGFSLYARCQSILIVTEAAEGRVQCPNCSAIILRQETDTNELLHCAHCEWEMFWEQYHRTWQHQELYARGAADAFAHFVEQWPRVHTPQANLLLIDWLIHLWHWQAREDHQLGRPVGVNLIEGSRRQVLTILDELTYGSGSMQQMQEAQEQWRARWQQVRAAQKGR